jgi:choline dehydrogenase-like flavoprotein
MINSLTKFSSFSRYFYKSRFVYSRIKYNEKFPLNSLSVTKYNDQDNHYHSYSRYNPLAYLVLLASSCGVAFSDDLEKNQKKKNLAIDGKTGDFDVVIAGAGTAGCTTAYFVAKIMEDNNIPGQVLLIDRGPAFDEIEGPDPRLSSWYTNWGSFGEAHSSHRVDGTAYPVTGSTHNGVGGCGTHDTRITFLMNNAHRERVASAMGWEIETLDTYFQAALDLMPLVPAMNNMKEEFYQAWIESLTNNKYPRPLNRLPQDTFPADIVMNSIAQPLMAYYHDELRWTSAYLLSPNIKPKNLTVLSHSIVDNVTIEQDKDTKNTRATGLVIHTSNAHDHSKVDTVYLPLSEHSEVLLTSGALGTAGILQRSGVGSKEELSKLGIKCSVDNPEVGHGVDHSEIVVMYEWLDRWLVDHSSDNTNTGTESKTLPRGGATGWPLILFSQAVNNDAVNSGDANISFMAHAGAGYAEPYTAFPSVVMTPNCMRPDDNAGYYAHITSKNPFASMTLTHLYQDRDYTIMAYGVQRCIELFEYMAKENIVGKRILPPSDIDIDNIEALKHWIASNHFTAFHWACTCQSGRYGRVADEYFRVRTNTGSKNTTSTGVISNLRVGSAAALPEVAEANPHLSITAFSIALAYVVCKELAVKKGVRNGNIVINELNKARKDLEMNKGKFILRNPGEETPKEVRKVAEEYAKKWLERH